MYLCSCEFPHIIQCYFIDSMGKYLKSFFRVNELEEFCCNPENLYILCRVKSETELFRKKTHEHYVGSIDYICKEVMWENLATDFLSSHYSQGVNKLIINMHLELSTVWLVPFNFIATSDSLSYIMHIQKKNDVSMRCIFINCHDHYGMHISMVWMYPMMSIQDYTWKTTLGNNCWNISSVMFILDYGKHVFEKRKAIEI